MKTLLKNIIYSTSLLCLTTAIAAPAAPTPASTTSAIPLAASVPTAETNTAKPILLNRIIAIVNQNAITQSQFDQALAQADMQIQQQGMTAPDTLSFKRQVLQQLILQNIALQLAQVNNINISADEVTQTINSLLQQNNLSLDQLKQMLQQFNVSYDQYRQTIRTQLIITRLEQKAVAGSIMITPQEISNYLAARAKLANPDTQYDISHILMSLPNNPTPEVIAQYQAKAQQLATQLRQHQLSFDKAAMEYSNAGDAMKGGNLGYQTLTQLPTLFVHDIPGMKVGDIVGPIQDASGFHIFTLEGIKTPQQQPHYVTQYHVFDIVIPVSPIMTDAHAMALLNQLKEAIQQGQSFTKLAETNSQDPDTRSKGGDMGWINPQQLNDPIMTQQIMSTPINSVSSPFKSNAGWVIIQVTGTRQHDDTKEYLRQQAAEALFRQKAENALQTWQQKIQGESYIHILVPDLRPDATTSS